MCTIPPVSELVKQVEYDTQQNTANITVVIQTRI